MKIDLNIYFLSCESLAIKEAITSFTLRDVIFLRYFLSQVWKIEFVKSLSDNVARYKRVLVTIERLHSFAFAENRGRVVSTFLLFTCLAHRTQTICVETTLRGISARNMSIESFRW